jgi:cytochrome c
LKAHGFSATIRVVISKKGVSMKSWMAILGLCLWASPFASVWASTALAQKNSCLACHAVDRKVVGPAYQDVAKKYAGNTAPEELAKRIKSGGAGNWGPIPMPAQTALSDADAKALAVWILGGAK